MTTRQIVIFAGEDAGGHPGLWLTDGTAAGTSELTGISGAGTDFTGLTHAFTQFGTQVFFSAQDASGADGLWASNGTAAGTHELTGISGANTGGVHPANLTVLSSPLQFKMLFSGFDTSGKDGLWVSSGTAAGTSELGGAGSTGISGVSSFVGLEPQELTAFHPTALTAEALFSGFDTSNNAGLWVTDGTIPGTHELTGISGASTNGLDPSSFAPVFAHEVLFTGQDTNGQFGLWLSNGTVAGTHELTGIIGASSSGLSAQGFTAFNGQVLFAGSDAFGLEGLWVTDGTAGGTHELTGINGIYQFGLFNAASGYGDVPFDPKFTVFNNEVLFEGRDTAGKIGLWVTDGTAAGTHELTGISGAGTGSFLTVFPGPSFAIDAGQVVFGPGIDASGQFGLWVTDGTAAGTHELTGITGANTQQGLIPFGMTTITQTLTPVKDDFNGDGMSDVVLQNTDGTPQIWLMNGTSVTGMTTLANPGPSWQVAATGDFNLDARADIVWQNTDGLPVIWEMNGTSIIGGGALPNPGPSWHVIATGDFNADGIADILLQNTDGAAAIWEMNGTSIIGGGALPNPGSSWHAIGTGDFNGDGISDILLQNTDGLPVIWEMNGTSIIGGGALPNPGSSWHAIGTGDFNGDGMSDILLQNADGLPVIWEMNGTAIIGGGALPNPGASWHAIGTGDFNGDGKADIILQNTDGLPVIWEMNGTTMIGGGSLPNPGAGWQVKDDGPIPADQMSSGSQQPALHVSAPDAANAVAMLSSPDTASPALHLSAPDGSNNTPGANNSVIGVNNTLVGASLTMPPDGSGSGSPAPNSAGSPGTFGFGLSPPPGVSPQFAGVWTSLVDSPAAQTVMQKLFTGSG